MMRKRILCSYGTRPEAIKMAPLIQALQDTSWCDVRILATAQHRELLDSVNRTFDIVPHADLNVMRANQSLSELTSRLISALEGYLDYERPHAVIAQGDTTTVMATALVAYYHKIPFFHLEAGLRSGELFNPFPEEANRVIAGHLSALHFAPTLRARDALLREGIPRDRIVVTGNTVIDALRQVAAQELPDVAGLPEGYRTILMTAHRRESFGRPIREIFRAIRRIADVTDDVVVVFPAHPNPDVQEAALEILADHQRVYILEPQEYRPFVGLMRNAYLIVTDSGGVQEEAPALGKPVLVMRETTERPEAVDAGVVKIVGTRERDIFAACKELLDDAAVYRQMSRGVSPYGDGKAALRCVAAIERYFDLPGSRIEEFDSTVSAA